MKSHYVEHTGLSVVELIDNIREEMCRDYCKYSEEATAALDTDEGCLKVCETCPMSRL